MLVLLAALPIHPALKAIVEKEYAATLSWQNTTNAKTEQSECPAPCDNRACLCRP